MKLKKIAKDRVGKVLEEGNIIHCGVGDYLAVIRAIVQPSRDELPYLRVTKVMTDWKGKNPKVSQSTMHFDDYKLCRIIDPALLRDDVESHVRIKKIREQSVIGKGK